jgi:hypothetical protein
VPLHSIRVFGRIKLNITYLYAALVPCILIGAEFDFTIVNIF